MRKLTKRDWRARDVFNPHNLAVAGGTAIYIDYRPKGDHRSGITPAWQVCSTRGKTDPNAHWMDYGKKTFSAFADKDEALRKAMAWAEKEFGMGLTEWERSPFGSWHPAGTMEKAARRPVVRPEEA